MRIRLLLLFICLALCISICLYACSQHFDSLFESDNCGPEDENTVKSTEKYCPGNANQSLHQHINNGPVDRFILQQPRFNTSVRYKMILLVISRVHWHGEREDVRRVWANGNVSKMIENGECAVLFVIGRSDDPATREEADTHGDLLQIDIAETYWTVVYKMEVAFRWIKERTRSDFVGKLDADTVADVDRLYGNVNKYQGSNPGGKDWLSCYPYFEAKPYREECHKWFVSEVDFPNSTYPTFCKGPAYAMGRHTFDRIVDTMKNHKVVEPEDVFFTGIVPSSFGYVEIRREDTSYEYKEEFICEKDGSPVQSTMTSHGQCYNDKRQRNIAAVYEQLQKPKTCESYID